MDYRTSPKRLLCLFSGSKGNVVERSELVVIRQTERKLPTMSTKASALQKQEPKIEVIRPKTIVKISIAGNLVELTEEEAKAFANDLCDQLGIRKPATYCRDEYDKLTRPRNRDLIQLTPMWPSGPPGDYDKSKIWCSVVGTQQAP